MGNLSKGQILAALVVYENRVYERIRHLPPFLLHHPSRPRVAASLHPAMWQQPPTVAPEAIDGAGGMDGGGMDGGGGGMDGGGMDGGGMDQWDSVGEFGAGMDVSGDEADEAEEDDEYEDVYVVLELAGVEQQYLASCDSYSIIGLDTPTPMLQVGNATFRGTHEEQLGTSLVFSDDKELTALPGVVSLPVTKDNEKTMAEDDGAPPHKLICKTTQRIRFERVLLEAI